MGKLIDYISNQAHREICHSPKYEILITFQVRKVTIEGSIKILEEDFTEFLAVLLCYLSNPGWEVRNDFGCYGYDIGHNSHFRDLLKMMSWFDLDCILLENGILFPQDDIVSVLTIFLKFHNKNGRIIDIKLPVIEDIFQNETEMRNWMMSEWSNLSRK